MPKLIIIRGAPGSGKSTLALEMHNQSLGVIPIFEADNFFYNKGDYQFDAKRLPEAHSDCFAKTKECLTQGKDCIVSNTFTKDWELKQYLQLTKSLGIHTVVIQCRGEFENIHGVPQDKVLQMRARSWTQQELRAVFQDEFPDVEYVNYDTHTQLQKDKEAKV